MLVTAQCRIVEVLYKLVVMESYGDALVQDGTEVMKGSLLERCNETTFSGTCRTRVFAARRFVGVTTF